jgi:Fis family transcriptional regulator
MQAINKDKVTNLHELIFEQIEPALLEVVMAHCRYNQLRTAKVLGISRGTCRSLLIKYFNDKYCGRLMNNL